MEEITVKRTYSFGVLLLCLVVSFSAAYGQGNCTIKTIAGTYAFNFTGSSTIVTGDAPDGFHWNSSHAPIAGVGVYTVKPDGTADGSYWLVAGAMNLGDPLVPTPFHATISINPDCTGLMNYYYKSYPMSEKFMVLDNGNEIRSMAVQTAVPTSTWNTTARRVGGACTQNKVVGSYLFACKSIFALDAANIFAGTSLMRMNISRDGSSLGTFTAKFGPVNVPDTQVSATFKVNDDCTAEGTLNFGVGQSVAKGVFFNEGKEGYWLPLVLNPGAVPQPYGYCDIKQIANQASPSETTPPSPPPAGAPKADAGVNFTTVQRQETLDGTKSTGTGLKFSWTVIGKTASMGNANTATPIVQFVGGYGEYVFELTVTDSTGATSTARVTAFYLGR